MSADSNRDAVKKRFLDEPPHIWRPWYDALLQLAPDFLEAYGKFVAAPWKSDALTPKEKELVWAAIDVATTHLFVPGAKMHIERALLEGARPEEIMEIIQIASQIGLHSYDLAMPILMQALKSSGRESDIVNGYGQEQKNALKDIFVTRMGYWNENWADFLQMFPRSFETALNFIAEPWDSQFLEPKIKALIWLAVNASTTHLYEPAIRVGVEMALKHGASPEQIVETLELTAVLGIHTCVVAMPILMQALGRQMDGA